MSPRAAAPKLYRALSAEAPPGAMARFFPHGPPPSVWTAYVRATHRDLAAETFRRFGHSVSPRELRTPAGTLVIANDLTRSLDAAGAPAEGQIVYNPRYGGELILARLVGGATVYDLIGDYPWETLTLPV